MKGRGRPITAKEVSIRLIASVSLIVGVLAPFVPLGTAQAATVSSAAFSSSGGTTYNGVTYAKSGAAMTLTVSTDANTQCVRLTNGANSVDLDSSTAQASWTFNAQTTWSYTSSSTAGAAISALFTAPSSGTASITATAYHNFNSGKGGQNGQCTANQSETIGAGNASYTVDSTAPTVTGAVTSSSPANGANWFNSGPVNIKWSATDTGSGVASGPTPATDTVTSDGVYTKTSTATDRAGNTGTGSVTVQLDTTKPTITGSRTPAANGNGWNNTPVTVTFACTDPAPTGVTVSGIKSCIADGTSGSTNTVSTDGSNQSVSGTATDNAGNSATASVGNINIDTKSPTLSGAPSSKPNSNGWYNSSVTVNWTCNDVGSGIDGSCPADSTISSEGAGQTVTAAVSDKAGNTTSATSSPSVNIDKTAPVTTAVAPPAWNNTDVTVTLKSSDNLSGVAATYYTVDGGQQQTGNSVTISTQGQHTLTYWSVDKAGNTETAHSVAVNIDKTPPTIGHTISPLPNVNLWNNSAVTVAFNCADVLSGIASCTGPQALSKEGGSQTVTGTATDNAGNTATDPAKVNIDLTKPTITGSASPAPNKGGWNNTDVLVSFTCADSLSGIVACPTTQTLHEGANQTASAAVSDAAGNSATTSVTGVNVDETPPTLSGAATTQPNANGWYNGDVTVHWTCGDNLSGVVACPGDSTVSGEGTGLTASASVSDKADNTTTQTIDGIKIDRTAPVTTASAPTGWQNTPVTVTLSPTDNLSGAAATYYTVDGGSQQSGTSVNITADGTHTVKYYSVDNAGNTETPKTITVQVDQTAPTIFHTQSPAANANGWNNGPVTVTFGCGDVPSGIASCTAPQTVSTDGAAQAVVGTATDQAGNTTTDRTAVNIDTAPPTITGSADRKPNGNGWYNDDVKVSFTCSDVLSGVDTCSGPTALGEGSNQSVTGTAVDAAGNNATATVQGINVDKTAPQLSGAPTTTANANGWYNGDVAIQWTCNDPDLRDGSPGSGIASCPANSTITGEGDNLFATGTATDNAGNSGTADSAVVKIDREAPTTNVTAPNDWTNNDVNVTLSATDNLSGVDATYYTINGGAQQTYDSTKGIVFTQEGVYTLSFWSVDKAGNTETAKSVQIKLDKTAPTITSGQTPAANSKGWNNSDVTVTFTCTDALSGVKTCAADNTNPSSPSTIVSTEGKNQSVTGTAVDNAGNAANAAASVSLDKTPPTISGATDRAANANGWYNAPVTVTFTCADTVSGVQACPAPFTLANDGGGQSASGTATDNADNSASSSVGGINVDQTAPTLSGAATAPANGAGWYNSDVTIHWTCDDPAAKDAVNTTTSGVASCPADSTITGEGDNLSATATDTDKAGNSTTETAGGIKIDRTAPTTSANAPKGWQNTNVTVNLTAQDALSGVAATYYQVDGGATQTGTTVTFNTEGNHTLTFWSVDNAGNSEKPQTVPVQVDKTPPTIGHTQVPAPNANGWNNTDVKVTFNCADQQGLSGMASCTPAQTVTAEGAKQAVNGQAVDNAGNSATDQTTVNIDKTAPTITGGPDRSANTSGWYNNDVTIKFFCDDNLSGVQACPSPTTLNTDGAGQTVTGTATDAAGNNGTYTVSGINLDKTPPTLSGAPTTQPNAAGWYNGDVTVHWTCGDALSGVAVCPGDTLIDSAGDNLSATATATDVAGNTTTASVGPIKIDRLAPTTDVSAPNDWTNSDVKVTLTATDNLSGVKATYYTITPSSGTEGAQQTYDSSAGIPFTQEGTYTLKFWSVDNADNVEAVKTVQVKLDKTAPTITHTQTPAPNHEGWNNQSVTVTFSCSDTGSGIQSCGISDTTPPSDTTMLTNEGKDQAVTGVAVDNAGNRATDQATVSIDKTPPTISASPDRPADSNGWYNKDVTITFNCLDALSGVAACSGPATLSQDGADKSVTGTASDVAGNSTSQTLGGGLGPAITLNGAANVINLDKTPPTLSGAATTQPNSNGWYNSNVTVHWTCGDGLSGVGSCPTDTVVSGEGSNLSSTATATDKAGNSTTQTVSGIKIDGTNPTTTSDAPSNWVNRDVTVHFTATDNLSGVDTTNYTIDGGSQQSGSSASVTGEGIHTLKFWSVDKAGNAETPQTATIRIDKTAPTISGAATTQPNAAGWYNTAATVHFACADPNLADGTAASGINTCQPDVTVSSNGSNQSATGTATDKAGNTASATVSALNIDTSGPTISSISVASGTKSSTGTQTIPTFTLGNVPSPTCQASDPTSGVASCTVTVTGGQPNGVGTFNYTASATDKAGNVTTVPGQYQVVYSFSGFLQPICDTAHQTSTTSCSTSVFKAGSTVPVKFQLKDAKGNIVQTNSAPIWLTPAKGSSTSAAVDTGAYSAAADSGTTFRWDGQQYIYNWQSPSTWAGSYVRIGVKLDDGQTYTVNIGLR